jgi:hypothetical protein
MSIDSILSSDQIYFWCWVDEHEFQKQVQPSSQAFILSAQSCVNGCNGVVSNQT